MLLVEDHVAVDDAVCNGRNARFQGLTDTVKFFCTRIHSDHKHDSKNLCANCCPDGH